MALVEKPNVKRKKKKSKILYNNIKCGFKGKLQSILIFHKCGYVTLWSLVTLLLC